MLVDVSEQRLTATVAGGGIAGLAAAVALTRAGWLVTVLERAPDFGEVGAGLAVTRNGMTALAALGVADAVRDAGYETVTAGIQDPDGRWLMRIPDAPGLRETTTIWGIHRRRLHAALLHAATTADGIELVTDAEVTAVRPGQPGGERAAVTWRSGAGARTSECDLVVAADGVRSVLRAQLFPHARLRYSGSTSWRGIITGTVDGLEPDGPLVQVWGPGAEFGWLRVSDSELYWYGYFRHPEGAVFAAEHAAARDRFSGWSPQVGAVIAATTPDRLMRHDVYHLPRGLPGYARGRVVLVGDAAHATLPTMGQGAATAVEDAVCVGRLIAAPVAADGDLSAALAAFDRARRPRCRRIARMSSVVAKVGADLGGGRRQTVRNALLRRAPVSRLVASAAPVLRWTAP